MNQPVMQVEAAMPSAIPSPAFVIGLEQPGDVAAREALLDRAMGAGRRRKSSEKLRRGRLPSEGLAFAGRDDEGALVGTVRLWDVAIGDRRALLLGPLAVDAGARSLGVGAALMRHAIAQAAMLGHGAIVLVGDPEYYERFGFSAEKTGAVSMPGPYERRRLLGLELMAGALDGASGTITARGRRSAPSQFGVAA
jgi:predicted N-acetyltransferase YhbS